MAKWIPGVAVFGLICLMVLPAPGIWGILIGGICVVAILISALVWSLDVMSSRMLARFARWRGRRAASSRRTSHAGSGTARKAGTSRLVTKRT